LVTIMKTRFALALFSCAVNAGLVCFSASVCAADAQSNMPMAWSPEKARAANASIMAYLGEPVPPPTELNPKYTADGLVAACKAVCAKVGLELHSLTVDDTEFPFLVYGVIRGTHDFQAMSGALRAQPGYTYGGSVVGRKNGMTYFSLNMMPPDQYPRAQREAIQRRLMIRLQMLGAIRSESAQ
jgi:hypothetical protein